MTNTISRLAFSLIVVALLVTACGDGKAELSPEEKAQRQDKAVDVSGTWVAADGISRPTTLTIENEITRPDPADKSSYDISGTLELGRELNDSENTQLHSMLVKDEPRMADQEVAIIQHDLAQALQSLVLAQGDTEHVRGGENVALDGQGQVSELVMPSKEKTFYLIGLGEAHTEYRVSAMFWGTAYKDKPELDYRITGNTDAAGAGPDQRKGLYLTLTRADYGGATRAIGNLWIELASFTRR